MTATKTTRVRVGGQLGVGATVVGAIAVGIAVYLGVSATVAVLGALLVGGATRKLSGDSNREHAAGSIGLVVGAAVVCTGLGLASVGGMAGVLVVVTASIAVGAVTIDAFVEDPTESLAPVWGTVSRSVVVMVIAMVPAFLISTGLFGTGVAGTVSAWTGLVGVSSFVSVVVLQLLAVGVLLAVGAAIPVLDEWRSDPPGEDPLEQFGVHPTDVPNVVWGILGAQALVAMLNPEAVWFEFVLSTLSVLGDALRWVLLNGVFHLPLLAVGLLASSVLVARGVQKGFVRFAGRNPPRTLAYAAGGLVASGLALVVAFVPDPWILGDLAYSGFLINGVATVALAAIVATLLVIGSLFLAFGPVSDTDVISVSPGYVLGSVALFVAALAAAGTGGPPAAVFVGVAGAFLAYDLGGNAAQLREQLGPEVDTRDAELTHASASILVGVAAVGLAVVALYVVGPSTIAPVDGQRATLALVLSVIALVCFAILVDR